MLPQEAIEKVEQAIMLEIKTRSKDKLWAKDRHDIPGAFDDKGNARFTIKLMPGVSNDLAIKCSSGTIVTYFIYGTNLLGGKCKISDSEFWKVLLLNISKTFPKAFHYSNFEAGVNRVLTISDEGYKVKGQKFKFDIDEIIPLISIRDIHIESMIVTVKARDKFTKNVVELRYENKIPFQRDIENECRIKLSQLRFQNDNRDMGVESDDEESIVIEKQWSREEMIDFYSWNRNPWPQVWYSHFN